MSVTGCEVVLRPAVDDDRDLLLRIYASTRAEELAVTGWNAEQQHAFLAMQFEAQRRHYRQHFPNARFDVICVAGAPAGRLYVDRDGVDIRIVDIALLPEHRGKGVGSGLLGDLLSEAAATARRVVIHVEQGNRARGLYERLGFQFVREAGAHRMMVWSARTTTSAGT